MDSTAALQTLPRTLNEILILSTVLERPKHGYQIALDIETRSDGYFGFKHGTLYPILHQLEKQGYIDGKWDEGRGTRRRKEYSITGAGRKHLAERSGWWRELGDRLSDFVVEAPEVRGRAAGAKR